MFLTRILTKSIPNTVKPALGALLPDSFSTDFSIYTIQESIQEPTPYIQDTHRLRNQSITPDQKIPPPLNPNIPIPFFYNP